MTFIHWYCPFMSHQIRAWVNNINSSCVIWGCLSWNAGFNIIIIFFSKSSILPKAVFSSAALFIVLFCIVPSCKFALFSFWLDCVESKRKHVFICNSTACQNLCDLLYCCILKLINYVCVAGISGCDVCPYCNMKLSNTWASLRDQLPAWHRWVWDDDTVVISGHSLPLANSSNSPVALT